MNRFLVALVFIVAFGVVRPHPALAESMDGCMQPGIAGLTMCVQHCAVQGFIANQGVAQSLLAKLDAAQTALDRGQPAVVVKQLEAFVQEVQAQTGKQIDVAHAQHMVMHAHMVIDALQVP